MSRKKSLDASQARACLEAAAQSGLTRTQWALVHRVDPRALDAWHARLQQPGREVPATDVRMVELVPADEPVVIDDFRPRLPFQPSALQESPARRLAGSRRPTIEIRCPHHDGSLDLVGAGERGPTRRCGLLRLARVPPPGAGARVGRSAVRRRAGGPAAP